MKKMGRILCLGLALVMLLGVVPSVAMAEKTKVSFWYINADKMPDYIATGFEERFEAANPDYDLELTNIVGTAADFETQFNAAKMSNTLPDLVYLTLTSFASLGTRGEFLSVQDRLTAWSEKDDFLAASLDMGKIGGEYTGIGAAPAPVMLCYRTDMFEAAGLDPEKPPTNWAELADYAQKLTIKDDKGNITQCGLDIPAIDNYLNVSEPFMLMNGAVVVDEVNGTPMLTDPLVIETLDYLSGLYQSGVTLPHDWQKAETIPFMNGISAMSFIGADRYLQLLNDKPELVGKVKMAPPVGNAKTAAFCGYRLLAITAGSKNPDAAWAVVDFFSSSDEMALRIDVCSVIPVRTSLQKAYVDKLPEYGQIVVDTVAVGKGAFVVPWVSILYKYYGPAYQEIMQGTAKPADIMVQVQKDIENEIANQ